MLTTIKGVYDEGKIILCEDPPVKSRAEVMVTFLEEQSEEKAPPQKKGIILGMLEGKIRISDDFNEPLDDLKDYM